MQPQQKDSKKFTDYWKTIVSKAQYCFNQLLSYLNFFWNHLRKHYCYVILALIVPIAIFALQHFQSERIAKDSQNDIWRLETKIDEMEKKDKARSQRIEKVFSEKIKPFEEVMQEVNRRSMAMIKKVTPPLKIFSEEPYGEFSCFDYVVFYVVKETEKEILFSNEESNPVVNFSFTYNKETGKIKNKPEAIRFNEKNPKASYRNYLGYLLFIKAEFSNARLVFWDLLEDKPFVRTGPTMPVNMRYDYKGTKAMISFVNKMIRIEHFLGRKIPFQLPPTELAFQNVNYVYEVLRGEYILYGFKYEKKLKNRKEKEEFLKHFWKVGFQGVEYRMEGKNDIVEIYGVPVELGMWTMDFPDSTVTPSIEDLKKDKSNDPVTITITTKNHDKEIVLIHNTHRSEYRLTDPPLPLFSKHPLMSQ